MTIFNYNNLKDFSFFGKILLIFIGLTITCNYLYAEETIRDLKNLKAQALDKNNKAIMSIVNLTDAGKEQDRLFINWWNWTKDEKKEYIDTLLELYSNDIIETFKKIEAMYRNKNEYFRKTSDGEETFIYWKKSILKNMEQNDKLIYRILDNKVLYPLAVTDWKKDIRTLLVLIGKEKKSRNAFKFLIDIYFQYPKDNKSISMENKEILDTIRDSNDNEYIDTIINDTKKTNPSCYNIIWRTLKPKEAELYDQKIAQTMAEEKERIAKMEVTQKEQKERLGEILNNRKLNHHYYPLIEGSQWIYNTNDTQTVFQIAKTKPEDEYLIVNLNAYIVIDGVKKSNSYLTYKKYTDKLVKLEENGDERPILYFPLSIKTVKQDKFQTFKVLSVNTTIEVPAGIFSQCIIIQKTFLEGGWVKQSYAPDIGLISWVEHTGRKGELVQYKTPQR